jgi:hypothetical protein
MASWIVSPLVIPFLLIALVVAYALFRAYF